ncbi:C40 family peptidase [Cohnella terricola]|uniref:NlpC/P60 domain-containing protein n=1 Tax=Cohnella terricola TaxID=1289167 RepID=A0A559JBT6_9BACL|nr:C40 family peptidase [Cohnella terricola]TVX97348.1 hypothetical protein FPZ45_18610 [Cohnella terricola]
MKMNNKLIISLALLLAAGCVRNPGDTMNLKRHSGPVKVQSEQGAPKTLEEGRHQVPVRQIQHTGYVSLGAIAQAMGYTGAWLRDGSYGIGDHDPIWTFRTGQSTVKSDTQNIRMKTSAIKEGNELFVPASALQSLFGDVAAFDVQPDEVAFFPKPSPYETGASGKSADFADDLSVQPQMTAEVSQGKATSMISFAKKYLGIKYEFGTGSYKQTGTFDCSSFTQYVFGQYGINLPRVAGEQAKKGVYVARDKLQAGDLLFFYVPGRFKSNKKVGHVGIYMGNGNMIHSCPKPKDGVQITPIDKAYWKDTYLFSRRYT